MKNLKLFKCSQTIFINQYKYTFQIGDTMELEIFSDETYILNKKYIGIACLFVPTSFKEKLVNKLLDYRCLNDNNTSNWQINKDSCKLFNDNQCNPKYHINNDCEIHYAKFRKGMSNSRKIISTRWIDFLVNNNKSSPENERIYFNILFLDLEKLDSKFFGEDKTGNNIYNRFYKTAIIGPIKYFFKKYNNVSIKEIFHDNADDKKVHDYFYWHTPLTLDSEHNIIVKNKEITFIDSNHKKYEPYCENYKNATLVQFIDLILGCTSHAIFRESEDKEKMILYEKYYPLISRLWKHPNNKNSEFNYFKSQQVSIFPKEKISYYMDLLGNVQRKHGEFHRDVKLVEPISSNSRSLDDYIKF